jgi:hypothetical protein
VKADAVRRELLPDQSRELLRELHLLTPQGTLNADALRKLKQVNHLVGLLRPALDDVFSRFGEPVVVDAASGNGYLAFVLYELYFKPTDKGELHCIESRPELTERARARAAKLGFTRMHFHAVPLAQAAFPQRFHLLTALHACDTATDDALLAGIQGNVDHLAVVPCCQAEVANQLKEADPGPMSVLHAHPWHRREFGAHLTNVVRALALEAAGYRVTVTELTGWEHSLKNELILARKTRAQDAAAKAQLEQLLSETHVAPKLIRALKLSTPPQ